MDDERRVHAVADDELAREIERAMQINPSPAFAAGVRARIAEEAATANWFGRPSVWAAVAACVLLLAAGLIWQPRGVPSTSDAASPPIASQTRAGETGVPFRSAIRPEAPTRTAAAPTLPSFDVVIAADEAAAIRRVLATGMLRIELALEAAPPVAASPDIVIAPIKIDPLFAETTIEGVEPW